MTAWDLDSRVALITGGARGIGLQTARRLVARGMRVAIVHVDGPAAAARADELAAGRAIGLAADVTDRAALAGAVSATVERFGGIDVCVANAAVVGPTATVAAADAERLERTIEVDLFGVVRTARADPMRDLVQHEPADVAALRLRLDSSL